MSEYATESPVSLRKRRKRRRALITIGTILLGLFFAFWYALSYYETGTASSTSATGPAPATCRTPAPDEVSPEEVSIRVLNATTRTGLAAATAKDLGARGFRIIAAANDTSTRPAPKVAEIRYGPAGESRAKLLATVMPDGTTLSKDTRKGTDVDLALGAGYTSLKPPVTPSAGTLPPCPSPSISLPTVPTTSPTASPSGT